ncbi:MAG: cyclic nucleotide-binding domain-containing protein, partial [Acetobacteraceae bacterium]
LAGYAASLTVFASFCMTTMLPLRVAALASNVLFALYGWFDALYPVLILHFCLFPVNVWRLVQVGRVISGDRKNEAGLFDFTLLRPHMTEYRLRQGETLFRLGDHADVMFYIVAGELVVSELGANLGPGEVVGEMGILARNRRRTATVVAKTDCILLSLSAAKARELFFQYPAFTLRLLGVLTDRLIDNVRSGALAGIPSPTPQAASPHSDVPGPRG